MTTEQQMKLDELTTAAVMEERQRALDIFDACLNRNKPHMTTNFIMSGKSLAEVEAALGPALPPHVAGGNVGSHDIM